jgi:hypothetical protein
MDYHKMQIKNTIFHFSEKMNCPRLPAYASGKGMIEV